MPGRTRCAVDLGCEYFVHPRQLVSHVVLERVQPAKFLVGGLAFVADDLLCSCPQFLGFDQGLLLKLLGLLLRAGAKLVGLMAGVHQLPWIWRSRSSSSTFRWVDSSSSFAARAMSDYSTSCR